MFASVGVLVLVYDPAVFFGNHGHGLCGPAGSWPVSSVALFEPEYGEDALEMNSLLKTSLNSVHLNLPIICLNSKENGGPFRILILEVISVSVDNELRNEAYALSADAPKMMCLQWTS